MVMSTSERAKFMLQYVMNHCSNERILFLGYINNTTSKNQIKNKQRMLHVP
jgi:hypothetical protein